MLLLGFGLVGCSNIQTDRSYQEIGRSEHFNLNEPGYIVGIEKRNIRKNNEEFIAGINSNTPYDDSRFKPVEETDKFSKKQNVKYKEVTSSQTKVMLVTQITKNFPIPQIKKEDKENLIQEYLYNAYKENLNGDYDFKRSFSEIDNIFCDLEEQLATAEEANVPYSHVLIMSMGWHTDQVETLWRSNKILSNIRAAKDDKEKNLKEQDKVKYKPLVIVLTWPSAWLTISNFSLEEKFGHLISYNNKADDADEIGFTWANWIVNHKLPIAIEDEKIKKPPKIVLIGHSFGARLLSRALFSSGFIKSKHKTFNSVDLFIGLQGAVSAHRFVQKTSSEGAPYSDYSKLPTKLVFTTSSNDTANPWAYWLTRGAHIGGYRGLNVAKKKENEDIFDIVVWNEESPIVHKFTNKVLIVDASSIIKTGGGTTGEEPSAHNDIIDLEMGKLIWNYIGLIP